LNKIDKLLLFIFIPIFGMGIKLFFQKPTEKGTINERFLVKFKVAVYFTNPSIK
jgi:hypothetical protein